MDKIMKVRYDRLGPVVAEALGKRSFEAHYCSSKEEAFDKVMELIPETASVSWGGSLTIDGLNLKEALKARGNKLFDRDAVDSPEEKKEMQKAAFGADAFLMSSNAISEDGQLVNIDGTGNRVAALIYGPDSVIIVAGMNKIVKSVDDAYSRARNIAAPANSMRIPGDRKPCKSTGCCADCNGPECICNQIVITRRCNPPKRIKVVLVGEDLGL